MNSRILRVVFVKLKFNRFARDLQLLEESFCDQRSVIWTTPRFRVCDEINRYLRASKHSFSSQFLPQKLAIQYERNLASKQVFLQPVSAQKYRTITRIGKNLVQKFHHAMFSIVLCCLENISFCAYLLSALT